MSSVSPSSSASQIPVSPGLLSFDSNGSVPLVLEQMRAAGATPVQMAEALSGYLRAYSSYVQTYAVVGAAASSSVSVASAGASTSSVSSGSSRSSGRGSYVSPGHCYLKAVLPRHAFAVKKLLGPMPTFSRIAALPMSYFRSHSDLSQLRVTEKSAGVCHLARGFVGDSFLDVMKCLSREHPGRREPGVRDEHTLRGALFSSVDAYPTLSGKYAYDHLLGAGEDFHDVLYSRLEWSADLNTASDAGLNISVGGATQSGEHVLLNREFLLPRDAKFSMETRTVVTDEDFDSFLGYARRWERMENFPIPLTIRVRGDSVVSVMAGDGRH